MDTRDQNSLRHFIVRSKQNKTIGPVNKSSGSKVKNITNYDHYSNGYQNIEGSHPMNIKKGQKISKTLPRDLAYDSFNS
jgi:hypothetical protein